MTIDEILRICLDDRFRFMRNNRLKISVVKKMNADLLIKFCCLMLRSFGPKREKHIVFIDEVNNKSMFENLQATIAHCMDNYGLINLRNNKRSVSDVKAGWWIPLYLLIKVAVMHVMIYVCVYPWGWERGNRISEKILVMGFTEYLEAAVISGSKIYCMTDHNFYSTIACSNSHFESFVIQHGLVMDKSYYYPIIADHFLAWGEHSKELLDNDPKVMVTGTYKFDKLKNNAGDRKDNSMLYCISQIDTQVVKDKIHILYDVAKSIGYTLKVKLHQGSLFNNEIYEKEFSGTDIRFYKEHNLSDIDFDFAIIENSTILLDLLAMQKPFVIYDSMQGYFCEYADDLIWISEKGSVKDSVCVLLSTMVKEQKQRIVQRELNNDLCSIFDSN